MHAGRTLPNTSGRCRCGGERWALTSGLRREKERALSRAGDQLWLQSSAGAGAPRHIYDAPCVELPRPLSLFPFVSTAEIGTASEQPIPADRRALLAGSRGPASDCALLVAASVDINGMEFLINGTAYAARAVRVADTVAEAQFTVRLLSVTCRPALVTTFESVCLDFGPQPSSSIVSS